MPIHGILFFVVGSMLGYATTAIVALIRKTGAEPIAAWRYTFLSFTVVGAILLLIPAFAIKEKEYVCSVSPKVSLMKSLKHAFSNKYFRIVTVGQLFETTGMSFFQACIMYYITELMGIPEERLLGVEYLPLQNLSSVLWTYFHPNMQCRWQFYFHYLYRYPLLY